MIRFVFTEPISLLSCIKFEVFIIHFIRSRFSKLKSPQEAHFIISDVIYKNNISVSNMIYANWSNSVSTTVFRSKEQFISKHKPRRYSWTLRTLQYFPAAYDCYGLIMEVVILTVIAVLWEHNNKMADTSGKGDVTQNSSPSFTTRNSSPQLIMSLFPIMLSMRGSER